MPEQLSVAAPPEAVERGAHSDARPLRVVHVFHSFPNKWQRYTYESLRRLAAAGVGTVAVSAVRLERDDILRAETPIQTTGFYAHGPAPLRWLQNGLRTMRSWPHRAALYRLMQERGSRRGASDFARLAAVLVEQPDVVHVHHAHAINRLHLEQLCAIGVPWVLSVRGGDVMVQPLTSESWRADLEWKLRHASAVHAVSHAAARRAVELGASEERTHVIPRALEVSVSRGVAGPPRAPYKLLSIGRVVWEKGHMYAVDAVAELIRSGFPVEYEIAGSGPLEPAVLYRASQLGVSGNVRLLGYLDNAALEQAMAGSHLLLHPSLTEAMPNTVIRAQAMGLPVVGTDVGGIPEVARDGATGLLVPPGSPSGLAEAVREALQPERWEAMSRQARGTAFAEFEPRLETERLIRLYSALAGIPAMRSFTAASGD